MIEQQLQYFLNFFVVVLERDTQCDHSLCKTLWRGTWHLRLEQGLVFMVGLWTFHFVLDEKRKGNCSGESSMPSPN